MAENRGGDAENQRYKLDYTDEAGWVCSVSVRGERRLRERLVDLHRRGIEVLVTQYD